MNHGYNELLHKTFTSFIYGLSSLQNSWIRFGKKSIGISAGVFPPMIII